MPDEQQDAESLAKRLIELHKTLNQLDSHDALVGARIEYKRLRDGHAVDISLALLAARERVRELERVAKALLLFHDGEPWTNDRSIEWFNMPQQVEATTKILCDCARAALAARATREQEVQGE